jgi:capsular exopolysaccharide synthesis family protein
LIQALKKDYAALEAEYSQQSRTYKADYPKMVRLKEQMNQLKARIDLETKKTVKGLKRDYEAAMKRETYLQASLKKATAEASGMNEKMVQYNILKRDAEANRELYNGLLQRLKETGVSVSLTTSNIQVLDRAEAPRKPQKPNVMLNCMLAVFFGLFGGVGLAFFMEYLDNTFKSQEDLERVVALPSLGIVPDFSKKGGAGAAAITFEDTRSPLSEAYRSIGTYVQFSSGGRPPKTILVTSANEGEGKTTTAANLAISLARSVGKGIIVDADMRRARLHRVFDIDNSRGLSAFLAGHIEFGDGLIHKTGVGNLDAIPSGILPPNPSDLLSSYRMKDLINGLFSLYSFVVIDSPPLLGLSDSCILSTLTDGVIMVTKSGVTQKDAALQAKRLLQGVNAKILGVVLNSISETDLKYGMYSYNYYRKGYDDEGNGKRKRDT